LCGWIEAFYVKNPGEWAMSLYCLFDLDDTLYPEHEFMISGHRFLANKLRLGEKKQLFLKNLNEDIKNHRYKGRFERAFQKCNLPYTESKIRKIVKMYKEHKPDIHLYPGASSFLRKLEEICKIIIVSEGEIAVQMNKIKALGIDRYTTVITALLGENIKKTDDIFVAYLKSHVLHNAKKILVFGDNPLKDGVLSKKINGIYIRSKNEAHKCFSYPTLNEKYVFDPEIDYNNIKFVAYILDLLKGDHMEGQQ